MGVKAIQGMIHLRLKCVLPYTFVLSSHIPKTTKFMGVVWLCSIFKGEELKAKNYIRNCVLSKPR